MKKPFFTVDGARIEIDGNEVLVVIVPTDFETTEQMEEFQRRFSLLGKFEFPIALATREVDGKILAVGTGTSREKLQARIDAGIQWARIPFYPE